MIAARRRPSAPHLVPAAAIRGFRARHRLSQRELGELIGVSHVMVHHIESGAKPVPHRLEDALLALFDAPASELTRPVVETLDEQDLLLAFRHLPEGERAALLAMVRS
jgi:transcriptional regulator with XRE-family HTH domain